VVQNIAITYFLGSIIFRKLSGIQYLNLEGTVTRHRNIRTQNKQRSGKETMSKPNLFSYATSELSQDAFICWLLSRASPEYKDLDVIFITTRSHVPHGNAVLTASRSQRNSNSKRNDTFKNLNIPKKIWFIESLFCQNQN
jgi:hypothetical protein